MSCSLGPGEAARRVVDWQRVLDLAATAERTGATMRVVFAPSTLVIAELARLQAAETECCPLLIVDFEVTSEGTVLTIEGPAGSEELMDRFFDSAKG